MFDTLKKCIIDYCYDNDVSFSKLSRDIGRHRSYIDHFLKGQQTPSLDTYIRLINVIKKRPTLTLVDELDFDSFGIIEESYAELAKLEKLNLLTKEDTIQAVEILKTFLNKSKTTPKE